MEFVPLVVMLATVKKLIDVARCVRGRDINGAVTPLVAWAAGFAVVALVAHTPWATGLVFGGVTLAGAGWAAQLLVGVAVGSSASIAQDLLKAVDHTQSEAKPALVDTGGKHEAP